MPPSVCVVQMADASNARRMLGKTSQDFCKNSMVPLIVVTNFTVPIWPYVTNRLNLDDLKKKKKRKKMSVWLKKKSNKQTNTYLFEVGLVHFVVVCSFQQVCHPLTFDTFLHPPLGSVFVSWRSSPFVVLFR